MNILKYEKGLIILSCGNYGNVIRTLMPLVITNEELDKGLGQASVMMDGAISTMGKLFEPKRGIPSLEQVATPGLSRLHCPFVHGNLGRAPFTFPEPQYPPLAILCDLETGRNDIVWRYGEKRVPGLR